jgi:chromo domain-containing protein 1
VDFETSAARINNDNNDHRSVHAQPFTTSEKLLEVQAPARILCDKLKNIIEDACKIDFQTMFSCFGGREDALDRRAFLFFHPEYHAEELELITRWLLIHHVEVGSLWVSGSWDYFQQKIREGGSGVIIVS